MKDKLSFSFSVFAKSFSYDTMEKNYPKYLDHFDIAYPFGSWTEVERLEKAGLDANCNEFCRSREIKAHYGVYFYTERPEK